VGNDEPVVPKPCAEIAVAGMRAPLRLPERGSTFLTICWEQVRDEKGGVVPVRATLCRQHRREIASVYPTARGSGQVGDSCDACEGRLGREGWSPIARRRAIAD
jgi:hypothetical protein